MLLYVLHYNDIGCYVIILSKKDIYKFTNMFNKALFLNLALKKIINFLILVT